MFITILSSYEATVQRVFKRFICGRWRQTDFTEAWKKYISNFNKFFKVINVIGFFISCRNGAIAKLIYRLIENLLSTKAQY